MTHQQQDTHEPTSTPRYLIRPCIRGQTSLLTYLTKQHGRQEHDHSLREHHEFKVQRPPSSPGFRMPGVRRTRHGHFIATSMNGGVEAKDRVRCPSCVQHHTVFHERWRTGKLRVGELRRAGTMDDSFDNDCLSSITQRLLISQKLPSVGGSGLVTSPYSRTGPESPIVGITSTQRSEQTSALPGLWHRRIHQEKNNVVPCCSRF